MTLELDSYGVSSFKGEAELFDEWRERSIDLFYSRTGELQTTTAMSLRGSLKTWPTRRRGRFGTRG
eukprot:11726942-Alexandrium_andersonii.AAC.1